MTLETVLQGEHVLLREELRQLKQCQLRYFVLSVGGSGLLFGLYEALPGGTVRELTLMAPLAILLPCWWTFFDKATTITRLVGYLRFCEKHLATISAGYIGYETGLAYFRETEDKPPPESRDRPNGTAGVASHAGRQVIRHGYWIVNWLTFFTLSTLAAVLPLIAGVTPNPTNDGRAWFVYLGMALVALVGVTTGITVYRLRVGRLSYHRVTEFWETEVLGPRGLVPWKQDA